MIELEIVPYLQETKRGFKPQAHSVKPSWRDLVLPRRCTEHSRSGVLSISKYIIASAKGGEYIKDFLRGSDYLPSYVTTLK